MLLLLVGLFIATAAAAGTPHSPRFARDSYVLVLERRAHRDRVRVVGVVDQDPGRSRSFAKAVRDCILRRANQRRSSPSVTASVDRVETATRLTQPATVALSL